MRTFYHDPSRFYVDPTQDEKGNITVRLRAYNPPAVKSVSVRILDDAEPRHIPAHQIKTPYTTPGEIWWEAKIPVVGATTHYRWHIGLADKTTRWVNALGEFKRTVPDHGDFKVLVTGFAPKWYQTARIYQIFIDRFARSKTPAEIELPKWSTGLISDDLSQFKEGPRRRNLYGGDLWGIIDHLDHIQNLGFDTIYLTPFFEARSNHRYDARSFERVDPFLGGDAALIALIEACHARGMRFIGDLTTNHTGSSHEWFKRAQQDPHCKERGYYYWDEAGNYACWLGFKSLPKLNYHSEALKEAMFGPDGVIRRYLEPPFNMDGWRIDVANMTGRYRLDDMNHQVASWVTESVRASGTDKALIAEHCHDFGADVKGDTWQGAMNYVGFTRPIWDWLCPDTVIPRFLGTMADMHELPGQEVVDTIDAFGAETTWQVRQASYNLVSSHDTPRISDTLRGPHGPRVGLTAAYTLPGVPMVLYGEELQLPNADGDNCRVPMPWDNFADYDQSLLAWLPQLAALRQLPVISEGGLRWVHVSDDVIAYWRETAAQRLLVVLSRNEETNVEFADPLCLPGAAQQVYSGSVAQAQEGKLSISLDHGVAIALWEI